MPRPAFLRLKSVKCAASEDTFGSDELYGLLGSHQFKVGSFVQGQASSLDLEALIPLGVATLQVFERDIELDELLGESDLPQEMEVERVVTLWARSASYVCWLQVSSQPEG